MLAGCYNIFAGRLYYVLYFWDGSSCVIVVYWLDAVVCTVRSVGRLFTNMCTLNISYSRSPGERTSRPW